MAYEYRPYAADQSFLLPQSPRDWLPEGHLALFVQETVAVLDLSPIMVRYSGGRGPQAYHPRMLVTVMLYGYCVGVYSSRKIAAGCETDIAFRVLAGSQFPDFRTFADFRKKHLAAFKHLFLELLRLSREAGLVKLGHLSLDGSKYQANASKHKAMSYRRIQEEEPKLKAEIEGLLKQAEAVDAAEDAEYGSDYRGDELPDELRRREERLAKIQEAKRRLEERARLRARKRAEGQGKEPQEIAADEARAVPRPKEQSNFTDPQSRIMKTKTGWIQGYNAQIAVNEAGVILAEEVSGQSADGPRLLAMLDQAEANLKTIGSVDVTPHVVTADAGYCSESNLAALELRRIDAYIATGRERHHQGGIDPEGQARMPFRAAMRAKLQTDMGQAIYRLRKCMTEPVHGQIKQARGFRQFLLRGEARVQAEFTLVCAAHNLLKLWRSAS
jgi:transposase